jgi:hypothetical protein
MRQKPSSKAQRAPVLPGSLSDTYNVLSEIGTGKRANGGLCLRDALPENDQEGLDK